MKLSHEQKIRLYSHHDPDFDIEEDFYPIIGTLLTILAVWTGVVHFVDWATMDMIPWYAEPFTIIPLGLLLVMHEKYDSLNPMHWWPMFWGYQVKLPDEDRITKRPTDVESILNAHGGKRNVHIIDYQHIKFRRRSDAVLFSLRH